MSRQATNVTRAIVLLAVTVFVTRSSLRSADPIPSPEKPPAAPTASPAEFTAEDQKFYDEQVAPLFKQHCYKCHSHASGEASGDLVVDSRGALLTGGGRGPAIVSGSAEKSLLLKALSHTDPDLQMPEKAKLPQADIDIFKKWIEKGAPWSAKSEAVATNDPAAKKGSSPSAPKLTVRPRGKITAEDRQYWAFQPRRVVEPPTVNNTAWNNNPIDRFAFNHLEKAGLQPTPRVEKAALLRRVTYDLIGLPPDPRELEAFLNDSSPDAYANAVDRLLSSPRYGERWGRHWLDLVRYAESDGYKIDELRPAGYRYRDYVIAAFNSDQPYDQFVREQLAGDEIAPGDPNALTATGFLRLGIYEYNNRDVRGQWDAILNEITDVTGDVFLGLGVGCARCHDHKFDPILQKDYYRLRSFFAALDLREDVPLATAEQIAKYETQQKIWAEKTAVIRAQIEELEAPARKEAAAGAISKLPPDLKLLLTQDRAALPPLDQQLAALAFRQVQYEYDHLDSKFKDDQKKRLVELRRELDKFNAEKPSPLPTTLTAGDLGRDAPPTVIPKKGPDPIEPGLLHVIDEQPLAIPLPEKTNTTGRRAALADWITRPDNGLTTRVIVNRIWQHHFGRGLVATSSDFGNLGQGPSHPELLDWLAEEFVKNGWRMKPLHRLIVTSEAYCQAAYAPPQAAAAALKIDPENRLLWHGPTRRLDAEQIRDSILAATGKLDHKLGGPSVEANEPRRSIYVKARRNTKDPLLEVFDWPESYASVSERTSTTSPSQALLLLNSPLLLKHARELATRLERDHPTDEAARIEAAHRLLFGRAATPDELRLGGEFLAAQQKRLSPTADPGSNFQYAKMPYREGRAAIVQPDAAGPRLLIPESDKFPAGDFTFEAFVSLRSLNDDATVRVIASQGPGEANNTDKPGWAFGVTGQKSSYKPQVLVLQLWGRNADDKPAYEAVFSNLHLELNKPYFVAVTVNLAETGPQGITFYAKDLSNDDQPLQLSQLPHKVTALPAGRGPMSLGSVQGNKNERTWDGLIDDLRLSRGALAAEQLLLTQENPTDKTAGFWQFEMQPGMFHDSSGNGLHMKLAEMANVSDTGSDKKPLNDKPAEPKPQPSAWVDYCHVLLNASEFLYVD